jgi:general secretion pathway protein C
MQLPSFDRTASAQTAGVTLVTVAAAALFALAAAYWTWQWLAPRSASRVAAAPSEIRHATSAAGLFGTAQHDTGGAASAGIEIRLLGVMAATAGRNGYAVLRIEPRQIITVQEGRDIVPGIRLAAVGIDHVILERDGIRQILSWPTAGKTADAPVPRIGK